MKSLLKILLQTIIVTFFISCNKNKVSNFKKVDKDTQNSLETRIYKQDSLVSNKVVIIGTTDNILAFKVLNIMNSTYLFGRNHKSIEKKIFKDSIALVLDSIDKPLFSMITFDDGSNFFRGRIFLIPGDTIAFKIKNGEMKFYGKNYLHNNFYTELNKNTPEYNKNPYQGNLRDYKKRMKSIHNYRTTFLESYIKKYNLDSKLFINTIKTNLRQEYLHSLVSPVSIKAKFIDGLYYNQRDGLYPILYKEQDKSPEKVIDLSEYFGSISVDEFNNTEALSNSPFFKENINNYIRYYFLEADFTPYSQEKFLAEKKFIETYFEDDIKRYAIARMLRDYHIKGFGNSYKTIKLLKSVINEYEEEFTKPSYIEYLDIIKEDLEKYNFKLSKYALNSKFINVNGDTLSLKEVFNRSTERIKVVDFWASWCPPCIEQINKGKPFKDRLQVENNVEWIYISLEKDYKKWLEANKKLEHVLNFNNSFFLLKGRSSSLTKFFKVNQIPRYVIFNKKNSIILNSAPSPLDIVIFEKIIDDVKNRVN